MTTLPNISPRFANFMLTMDPRFVQYVVENHQNLSALLTNMEASTLHYVAQHVPKFGALLCHLPSTTLKEVFHKLSNIDEFMRGMDAEVVEALVAKVPSLAKYAPAAAMTTAAPVANATEEQEVEVEHPADDEEKVEVEAIALGRLIFTDEELGLVRAKIPLIDEVIRISDAHEVVEALDMAPNIAKTLINLDSTKLDKINSRLSNDIMPLNLLVDTARSNPLVDIA